MNAITLNEAGSTSFPPAAAPAAQSRSWEVLCHLSAFVGFFIPLGNIFAPMIVWLLKRSENPEVEFHGKESLNFQISFTIYTLFAALSVILLIGLVALPVVLLLQFIFTIIAAVRASTGERYAYPLTLRLVK